MPSRSGKRSPPRRPIVNFDFSSLMECTASSLVSDTKRAHDEDIRRAELVATRFSVGILRCAHEIDVGVPARCTNRISRPVCLERAAINPAVHRESSKVHESPRGASPSLLGPPPAGRFRAASAPYLKSVCSSINCRFLSANHHLVSSWNAVDRSTGAPFG